MNARNASNNVSHFYGAQELLRKENTMRWINSEIVPIIECASSEGYTWAAFNIHYMYSRKYVKNLLREMGYTVRNFRDGIVVSW